MSTNHVYEEYLEAIYVMEVEGVTVIGSRLAQYLGVSAPTVTETLQRIARHGLAVMNERKEVQLTPVGRERGEIQVRRHRLLERWMTDSLGMDWAQAHLEACKLDHIISPEIESRLSSALGDPPTCPHGNPIPGNWDNPFYAGIPLDKVQPGDEVTVERILEHVEIEVALLRYLWNHGIKPGASLKIVDVAPSAGTIIVQNDGERVSLGVEAASKIHVRPSSC